MGTDTLETPPVAAKEPVGTFVDDENLKKVREDANEAVKRVTHRDEKFLQRLDRRHAAKDGPEAVEKVADVRKREAERRSDQEKAASEAAERASRWIAPDEYKGRMDHVEISLYPEEKARKMTIAIRALGEVPDGFIMILEDPADPADPKQGRVYESARFGTKNKVRINEVDPKTQLGKGEHTHPGYFDTGPIRMHPGSYRAVVVDTEDKVLAEEKFEIVPDWDEDGQSDQVVGVRAPKNLTTDKPSRTQPREQSQAKAKRAGRVLSVGEAEALRAARGEAQVARTAARSAGDDVPAQPGGKPKLTPEERKALKDTPEGRAK